jgi:hypothetical protein
MKQILKDAFKSDELELHLTEVIAKDEKLPVEQLSDQLILKEAKYVLGKFTGESGGFEQEEDLAGENGSEQQRWAKKEVAALRKFLKKHI